MREAVPVNKEPSAQIPEIPADFDPLRLDCQLCFPLYAAARKVVQSYTPFLKPLGLTYTQYLVFLVLWEKDGIPVGELGAALHLDTGTLTPLLKKLESAGYLIRTRSPEDERSVILTLTDAGRALRGEVRGVPGCIAGQFPLTAEEAGELYRILYKLLD